MGEPVRSKGPISASETTAAAIAYLAATVLLTWPIAAHLGDGLSDLWDAKLNAWILHWDFHQTFRDPLRLFDANIFHPARYSLAFSENLYGVAILGFPLYAAGVSTLAVYNILFLLGMFLSALSAWALAKEVTGDGAVSWVAGLVYAFLPWRFSQVPHIQFQWGAFLPLLLLFLLRYLDSGRRRDLALFGLFLLWNALCNLHYGIFSIFLVATVLLFELVERPGARTRVGAALLTAMLAAVAAVPVLVPYARAFRSYGMRRFEHETEFFSGRPTEFFSAGFTNRVYGKVTRRWSHPEGDFFPGLAAVALAAAGLRRRKATSDPPREKSGRRLARILDATLVVLLLLWAGALARPGLRLGPIRLGDPSRLVVLATVIALCRLVTGFPARSRYRNLRDFLHRGPLDRSTALFGAIGLVGIFVALGLHTPYYRFLFDSFGFFLGGIRAPSRGIVLFHVALAVLAARGLSRVAQWQGGRHRLAIVTLAALLVVFEYRAAPLRVWRVDAGPRLLDRWLAATPLSGGVMEWPVGIDYDPEYEFRSTNHWKPLVNGASGFAPPRHAELVALVENDPIPDSVWPLLSTLDTSTLVLHTGDASSPTLSRFACAARRGFEIGKLALLRSFQHGSHQDFVFRLATTELDTGKTGAERSLEEAFRRSVADLTKPFGAIDYPRKGRFVTEGEWVYGWALDETGLAEVSVSTELGFSGSAVRGPRPDVARVFSRYPVTASCGWAFRVPALPSGDHVLTIRFIANDGGVTETRLPVSVR